MAYADSAVVTGTLPLQGVWLHDPQDPQGSVRHYPYGANARESSLEVEQEGTQYAGRTYPLVDYGEGEALAVGVSIDVPHGPDYQATLRGLEDVARLRRTLHLRDNRGRDIRGTLSGLKHTDQGWGSVVSFTITAVDVVDTEVV